MLSRTWLGTPWTQKRFRTRNGGNRPVHAFYELALVGTRLRQLRKLMRLLPSRGFRRGLLHGVAASVEHLEVMRGIALSTLIDVDANVGQFSLLMRTLHPGTRIYAFEPLSRPAMKFESLFRGDAQTTLRRWRRDGWD